MHSEPAAEAGEDEVRFGDNVFKDAADACMWSTKAVAIRFTVAEREHRCREWQGAVEEATRPPAT